MALYSGRPVDLLDVTVISLRGLDVGIGLCEHPSINRGLPLEEVTKPASINQKLPSPLKFLY